VGSSDPRCDLSVWDRNEQIDLTKTRRTITVSKPAELGDRQSLSKPAERRPQQINLSRTNQSQQQIPL
jgi:hypothetical protein